MQKRTVHATLLLESSDLGPGIAQSATNAYLAQAKNSAMPQRIVGDPRFLWVRMSANSRVVARVEVDVVDVSVGILSGTNEGDVLTGKVVGLFDSGVTVRTGDKECVLAIVTFPNDGKYTFQSGAWFLHVPEKNQRVCVASVGSEYSYRVTRVCSRGEIVRCFAEPV